MAARLNHPSCYSCLTRPSRAIPDGHQLPTPTFKASGDLFQRLDRHRRGFLVSSREDQGGEPKNTKGRAARCVGDAPVAPRTSRMASRFHVSPQRPINKTCTRLQSSSSGLSTSVTKKTTKHPPKSRPRTRHWSCRREAEQSNRMESPAPTTKRSK